MMEYAGAMSAQSAQPIPELGKIKNAAERIAFARSGIENFIGRFNGESACGGGGVGEASGGYRNDLVTLFGQIEQLEKVVQVLDGIG